MEGSCCGGLSMGIKSQNRNGSGCISLQSSERAAEQEHPPRVAASPHQRFKGFGASKAEMRLLVSTPMPISPLARLQAAWWEQVGPSS
jgi:hypothetical protein